MVGLWRTFDIEVRRLGQAEGTKVYYVEPTGTLAWQEELLLELTGASPAAVLAASRRPR